MNLKISKCFAFRLKVYETWFGCVSAPLEDSFEPNVLRANFGYYTTILVILYIT